MRRIIFLLLVCGVFSATAQVHKGLSTKDLRSAQTRIFNRFGKYPAMFNEWRSESEKRVRLERVSCSEGRVNLYFNDGLSQIAIREELCELWEQMVRDSLGLKYKDAKIGLFSASVPIERYIPNAYRQRIAIDPRRQKKPELIDPLVKPIDEDNFGKGLSYRHIALWGSHGLYYNIDSTRWEFQRPALFGTVEDLHTYLYCDQYLIPMLENAGAVVVSPRERDRNTLEIIIDADKSSQSDAKVIFSDNWMKQPGGFKYIEKLNTQNPFEEGSYMQSPVNGGKATYTTTLGKSGEYAVYVSYKASIENSSKAIYTVKHVKGESKFEVNQQIGGGWVYLGKFPFENKVEVTLQSDKRITADAVKIGGGMGSVIRGADVSQAPRWAEAARYFMQYSGVDTAIYVQKHNNDKVSDYMDDYKSRGDWVNYLSNTLKVPIDATIALYSNAGIVDSIFGTLLINHTNKGRDNYSDGKSKYAGRDFADIVQTQIVDDIRTLHSPKWVRRSLL